MIKINGYCVKELRGQKRDYYNSLYNKSHNSSVLDFYKSCSSYKYNAEREIKNRTGVTGYRVLCGNSSFFTVGYYWQDTETKKEYHCVETASNIFCIG